MEETKNISPNNLPLADHFSRQAHFYKLPTLCCLYYYPYSIHCIIVRFAFLLAQDLTGLEAPRLELCLINMQTYDHLQEEYLALNPTGQVS